VVGAESALIGSLGGAPAALCDRGPVFSPETDLMLRMVDAAVDQVDLQQSPDRLLQDEDWFKVQKAAENALHGVRRDLNVEG
jgi:hypothetical protein